MKASTLIAKLIEVREIEGEDLEVYVDRYVADSVRVITYEGFKWIEVDFS